MSKPVVLLVHGMGTHQPGNMTKEFTKGVNEAAVFLGLNSFDISEKVDLKEYNYSEKLDDIRKKAADHQGSISEYLQFISGGGLGSIASKLSSMEAKFGNDEFLYTHWLDVFYYGLTYHNEEIRAEWAEELNKLILFCHKNGRKLHVVGHSLGTAIVHDALAKLYREEVDFGDTLHLSAKSERFESLWMVANVSRLLFILTRFTDPNHSIVHDSNPDMLGCSNYFYNVGNKFDPFLLVKRYKRDIENGRHICFGEVRKRDDDLKVNPHDLTEYMACPDITRLFLYRTLGYKFSITVQDEARKKYRATTIQGNLSEAEEKISQFVNDLGDIQPNNISTVINSFEAAKKAIKEVRSLAD
ncbi:alpha/beta hydrolase [Motiliproteus coralliicola]|nr:alpha/beta hydrolase [Motiliproteus coralliicola]